MTTDLYASLTYNDAASAIEWLSRAFGFTIRLVVPGAENTVVHSELTLGNAVVMVSSPKPEMNRVSPLNQTGISQTVFSLTILMPTTNMQRLPAP